MLYQNGQPTDVGVYDLTKPAEVAELLNDFFQHAEPDIEGFHEAVTEFQERVPLLAKGLVEKIDEAHAKNAAFKAAFQKFFGLCQTTLNPNIRREAVDEMLVQHLLTERVFRTIFHESDFIRKNVIAAGQRIPLRAGPALCLRGTYFAVRHQSCYPPAWVADKIIYAATRLCQRSELGRGSR